MVRQNIDLISYFITVPYQFCHKHTSFNTTLSRTPLEMFGIV